MTVGDLTKILQASIAPVVLISGIALLLLTLTNRLGRSNDRIRLLCNEIRKGAINDLSYLRPQIEVLYQRCRYLQLSIILATLAIVFVSVIIFALFSIYLFNIDLILLVEFFFSASLVSFILSLLFFLRETSVTLRSLKIEIDTTMGANKS